MPEPTPLLHRTILRRAFWLCLLIGGLAGHSSAQLETDRRGTLYLVPTIEGLYACEEGAARTEIRTYAALNDWCMAQQLDASPAITRALDALEPGGPTGKVQVGFLANLQLLSLYRRQGQGWAIDDRRVDAFLRVVSRVQRPFVLYLAADHFDTQGPLTDELLKDPASLMQLSDGKAPLSSYFGYRIAPYTLLTDENILVNRYRFEALRHVARKILALPPQVRKRMVAITLAGELHQMFPDFENGMGRFADVRVTDYSPASVQQFRTWLLRRHGSLSRMNQALGTRFSRLGEVPAPGQAGQNDATHALSWHYDAWADGQVTVAGWLWDPQRRIQALDLFVDGRRAGPIERGLNRVDVYRAIDAVMDPNVGYRMRYDYRALANGRHRAQVVALAGGKRYLLGEARFNVTRQNEPSPPAPLPPGLAGLLPAEALPEVKTWLDLPGEAQVLRHNPLAREWNAFRAWQVKAFLSRFHEVARQAGLPADKLYSHQIAPAVNSSWNATLFAVEDTLHADQPWKTGVNLYGGAVNNAWLQRFLRQNRIHDYGVPEFNPQQWKRPGAHLEALQAHQRAGARFVSPYYLAVMPRRLSETSEHGVNAMALGPDNARDGSDQFYEALRTFARR
ncbi:MAG: hypothetical protein EKK45_26490 [Curvibacter sp.]|nr:MAG: hypothetical protein EKK45_26490 [Curvibacter sp.]